MTAEVKQESQTQEVKKDNTEVNFANLRKQVEQERAARMRAEEEVNKLKAIKQPYHSPQEDDDEDSDEPYIDQRSFKKKMSKFEERMSSTIDKRAEEKARILMEQEKQSEYIKRNPDFQNILSAENIQKFAEKHPAIAERMLRMPDNFDRQALLYEQIKTIDSLKKEEPKQSIQSTIDQNRRSPYYHPSGVGSAPYNSAAGDFSQSGQKNAYAKLQELKSKLRLG